MRSAKLEDGQMSDATKRMTDERWDTLTKLWGGTIGDDDGGLDSDETAEVLREALRARAGEKVAVDALKVLYEENADYIGINNLGDIHYNASMREAARIVAEFEAGE